MTSETCWTSIPRDQTSVVINTRLERERDRQTDRQTERERERGGGEQDKMKFHNQCRMYSSPVSSSKLLHDGVSLLLRHVPVHGGDGEVCLPHLLRQPLHLQR